MSKTSKSCRIITEVIGSFCYWSGQKVEKIFSKKCFSEVTESISIDLDIHCNNFFGTYLDVPIFDGIPLRKDLQFIIDYLQLKLSIGKTTFSTWQKELP